MNFFGHSAVATWMGCNARVAFGAMLPDFAVMSGARVPESSDADLTVGIALHHETDAAFHVEPVFGALSADAFRDLIDRGVGRGGARAAAHIATEIFLDAVLSREPALTEGYFAALACARDPAITKTLAWPGVDGTGRLMALCSRLASYGAPHEHGSSVTTADRIVSMTKSRPRLAFETGEITALRDALAAHQVRVEERAPALIAALRGRFRATG